MRRLVVVLGVLASGEEGLEEEEKCVSIGGDSGACGPGGRSPRWMYQFGTSKNEVVSGLAVDGASGRVYVGGTTHGALGGAQEGFGDAWMAALSGEDGAHLWSRQLGTAKGDELAGLGVLEGGKLAAAGSTFGAWPGQTSLGQLDGWRTAMDGATGSTEWEVEQMGTRRKDAVQALATLGAETVFLGGTTFGHVDGFEPAADTLFKGADDELAAPTNSGHGDAWIARYDGEAQRSWAVQIATDRADTLVGLAVLDHVLVAAGATFGDLGERAHLGRGDAWVAALDPADGSALWSTTLGTDLGDEASAVALDPDGNVLLAGTTFGFDLHGNSKSPDSEKEPPKPGGRDVFVAKLDANDGTVLWARLLGSDRVDHAHALAVAADRVYVGGSTFGDFAEQSLKGKNAGKSDAWFAILALADGDLLDATQFGHADRDSLDVIALAPNGNLVLAGATDGHFAACNAGLKDVWVASVPPRSAVAFLAEYDHQRHQLQPCNHSSSSHSSGEEL